MSDKIIGNNYTFNNYKVRLVSIEDKEKKVVYWSYDNGKYDWLHTSNIDNLITIDMAQNYKEEVDPPKPVYTQAMADKGILPSVGMECMVKDSSYDNKYYKSVMSFIGRENIVWTHAGTEYSQSKCYLEFKPIDTRTDEEKAQEQILHAWNNRNGSFSVLDAIKAGKIHNVTWSK